MKGNLQTYAQIAEIVGSIAIVVSLVFVGMEIRHNNAISRTEAYQRNIDALNDWRELVVSSGNAEAIQNFITTGQVKEGSEADIQLLQGISLMVFDRAYFSYRNGIMDKAGWDRFYKVLCPIWENQLKISRAVNFVSQDFIDYSARECNLNL